MACKPEDNFFTYPHNRAPSPLQSTTVLSPYLKFGCLSVRLFYARLQDVLKYGCGLHVTSIEWGAPYAHLVYKAVVHDIHAPCQLFLLPL